MDSTANFNANIEVGDFVKKRFADKHGNAERMWVKVYKIRGQKISGRLDNNPAVVDMAHGDIVTLDASEILDHMKA